MRNKLLYIALAVVFGLSIIWYAQGSSTTSPEVQEPLDLTDEEKGIVSATGTIVPMRQAKLAFARMGKVKRLAVQVGDSVQAGQVIAELEADDLLADVNAAQEALNLARAQLAQVEAGSRSEELEGATAALKGSQAKYDQVVAGANEAETEAAVAAVEGARDRLSQAEASARAQERIAEARLEAANARLGELLVGPKAEDVKAAELQLDQARNSLWAAQIDRDGVKGNPMNPEYMGKAGDARVSAAETAVLIAETNLLKLKAGASTEELRIARAAVSQAEAELDSARETKETTIQAAESGLRSAEARLAQLKRGATAYDVNIAASGVAGAKAALDLRTAGASQFEVEAAHARVKQAEALLWRAQVGLQEAKLAAPFGGVVASLQVTEGEVMNPGAPFMVLGDITTLRIETNDLRETSIAKVRVGQPVEITLDALPEKVLWGKVTRVAPMANVGAGGTNYTVTIDFDQTDPSLRWGMTANVVINVK